MKTFFTILKVVIIVLSRNKDLRKAKKLDKQGKIKERDALVHSKASEWSRELFERVLKGVNITVNGLENIPKDKAAVFIGNHQGYLDIPILLGYSGIPIAFISKAEILKIPVFSTWMKLMQCTFLVRSSPRQSIEAMNEAIENVKKGYSLVIFPEGHRSKGTPMKDFKSGSFKLAFKSEAPIIPFTINGTYSLFEENGIQPGNVALTFHQPVLTAGLSREQQQEIPAKIQEIVASALPENQKPVTALDS
ncbi:MAG: 1-acyl-sn-glycerol-3-phosphate acyltransferase [Treponema sp.]|jgi:1-acyl-sn-glycerol-3-phosphate acyltransferase|nr:1-acyl-sn-glycerol-3-phosphate acyltransferase [Treponema sp.]